MCVLMSFAGELMQIEEYQRENTATGLYSWEIHERLLTDGVCDRFNVPTIGAINRILQRLARVCTSSSSPTSICRRTSNSSVTSHAVDLIAGRLRICLFRVPALSCGVISVILSLAILTQYDV